MGGCCSLGTSVDPAQKAIEYELTDLQIEELLEFMASVDFGWAEVHLEYTYLSALLSTI